MNLTVLRSGVPATTLIRVLHDICAAQGAAGAYYPFKNDRSRSIIRNIRTYERSIWIDTSCEGATSNQTRPNDDTTADILIILDDIRQDQRGCYHNGTVRDGSSIGGRKRWNGC